MTLDDARIEAPKMATRLNRPVAIYRHVGGRLADGAFMQPQERYICWSGPEGMPEPRFVWALFDMVPVPGTEPPPVTIDQQAAFDAMTPEAIGARVVAVLKELDQIAAEIPGLAAVIASAVTDQRAAAAALVVDEPAPTPVSEPPVIG